MASTRQFMALNYQTLWKLFCGNGFYPRAAETPHGEPQSVFQGQQKSLMSRIRDSIYNPPEDYTTTVTDRCWSDFQHTWPVAAHWK